ncbi:hypothetical protein PL8927_380137 [Planktothrix serta PCC 8927]|uniref:Uncharacterized protein n=1 Tax=Planktothrix serta PCC 8927 TaxID=671068 RepID=A0A7Z9DZM6_9CYAN|nr:hypothetical protein PL8927_380137 [Planktothrix serta PCC 8927]
MINRNCHGKNDEDKCFKPSHFKIFFKFEPLFGKSMLCYRQVNLDPLLL